MTTFAKHVSEEITILDDLIRGSELLLALMPDAGCYTHEDIEDERECLVEYKAMRAAYN